MLQLEVIKEPGNPIISAWISSDSHYGFVEFRNAEEANLGFKLQGMNIHGKEIKIGRPKAYEDTMSAIGAHTGIFGASGEPIDDSAQMVPNQSQLLVLPSRILRLHGIANFENTHDLHGFRDLFSDVWDKCSEYANVVSITIIRPLFVDRTE